LKNFRNKLFGKNIFMQPLFSSGVVIIEWQQQQWCSAVRKGILILFSTSMEV